MSLVGIWVKADTGRWFNDPPVGGPGWRLDISEFNADYLMIEAAPADAAGAVFRQARRSMTAAQRGYAAFAAEPARRRAFYRCAKQVANRRGTRLAWLWYYWERLVTFSL